MMIEKIDSKIESNVTHELRISDLYLLMICKLVFFVQENSKRLLFVEWVNEFQFEKIFFFFFFIKTSTKIESACVRLVMFYLRKWAAPLCVWHTSCCVFIYEPELLDFEHSLELFWLEPPVFVFHQFQYISNVGIRRVYLHILHRCIYSVWLIVDKIYSLSF